MFSVRPNSFAACCGLLTWLACGSAYAQPSCPESYTQPLPSQQLGENQSYVYVFADHNFEFAACNTLMVSLNVTIPVSNPSGGGNVWVYITNGCGSIA
jgi:hypothetical protein